MEIGLLKISLISELKGTVAAQNNTISVLESKVAEQSGEISELKGTVAGLKGTVAAQNNTITQLLDDSAEEKLIRSSYEILGGLQDVNSYKKLESNSVVSTRKLNRAYFDMRDVRNLAKHVILDSDSPEQKEQILAMIRQILLAMTLGMLAELGTRVLKSAEIVQTTIDVLSPAKAVFDADLVLRVNNHSRTTLRILGKKSVEELFV